MVNVRFLLALVMLIFVPATSTAHRGSWEVNSDYISERESITIIEMSCNLLQWNDVVILVAPYQEEALQVALVQQAMASNYKVSVAAKMVLEEGTHLPTIIKVLLESIAESGC